MHLIHSNGLDELGSGGLHGAGPKVWMGRRSCWIRGPRGAGPVVLMGLDPWSSWGWTWTFVA